jgi:hypothetical protein
MSSASATSINACGCCRCKLDQFGASSVQPQPERAATDRAAEVVGDLRGAAEAPRVALEVLAHLGVGDVDGGGHVHEQRPSQWIGEHRARDAADLQPGRCVGQQLVLARRTVGRQSPRRRLCGDQALGHQQLRQPTAQLPAFAGAAARQRRREPRTAQPVFAGVDLLDPHRHAPDTRRDGGARSAWASRWAHRTVTFTAGE